MSETYRDFNAEDFAADASFREWVFEKKAGTDNFWIGWLEKHPEKRQEVVQAIALLKVLQSRETELSAREIGDAIQRTLRRIDNGQSGRKAVPGHSFRWAKYAAAFAVLLVAWWIFPGIPEKASEGSAAPTAGAEDYFVVQNTGSLARETLLPDGSSVTLDARSTIRYRLEPTKERIVLLTGGALFNVVKKPGFPFKVVTEEVVTKVLGTSFRVNSDPETGQTTVRVMTGKVEVSQRKQDHQTILYPNQEIIYTQGESKMTKSLVENPVRVTESAPREYVYEDTPISNIFEELEKMYGVSIRYDKELLAGCQVTASFSNETFWEKLTLVCRPIRAVAEEKEGEIFIRSSGCNF